MCWGRGATVPLPPGTWFCNPWATGVGRLAAGGWLVLRSQPASRISQQNSETHIPDWAYKPMLQILAPSISTRALTCMPVW